MNAVLIVDDEDKLRLLLSKILQLEGFEVLQAVDSKSALKKLEQAEIDIVLCDVKLPDTNGIDLVKMIKVQYPHIEVIVLTAYGNIPDGVQAIKNGAFDYITKGDDNNKIIPLLNRAMEKVVLAKRVLRLEKQLSEKYSFDHIIGDSSPIKRAVDLAQRVATTDATVLLTGETGTGKEVFAQAIHQKSARNKHGFVAINCSAFNKDILEREMFGHKAGAFTGAVKDQKGIFEEANHGTIFLDEIGEMPIDLQAKLLRVLESGEFIKVGDTKPTRVNLRIIAATNRNLEEEVRNGHFREDLFYRISVFQIELPPLRERPADIEPLAKYFLHILSIKSNKKVHIIPENVLNALRGHPWKGNIRELKNVIERSIILASGEALDIQNLPLEMQYSPYAVGKDSKETALDLAAVERIHIQKVLNHTNGNKTKTAELLGIALTTLYRKLAEYHIE